MCENLSTFENAKADSSYKRFCLKHIHDEAAITFRVDEAPTMSKIPVGIGVGRRDMMSLKLEDVLSSTITLASENVFITL